MKLNRQNKNRQQLKDTPFNFSLEEIAKEAALNYKGSGNILESAIGAMYVGQIYGWKVLRMIHGSNTYVKYEKILGVKFKDICPDRGPLASNSIGLKIADKLGGFWKVATGKVPGRTPELDSDLDNH